MREERPSPGRTVPNQNIIIMTKESRTELFYIDLKYLTENYIFFSNLQSARIGCQLKSKQMSQNSKTLHFERRRRALCFPRWSHDRNKRQRPAMSISFHFTRWGASYRTATRNEISGLHDLGGVSPWPSYSKCAAPPQSPCVHEFSQTSSLSAEHHVTQHNGCLAQGPHGSCDNTGSTEACPCAWGVRYIHEVVKIIQSKAHIKPWAHLLCAEVTTGLGKIQPLTWFIWCLRLGEADKCFPFYFSTANVPTFGSSDIKREYRHPSKFTIPFIA